MSTPGKRRDQDIVRLMMSKYSVEMDDESSSSTHAGRSSAFIVQFKGPSGTSYEEGTWRVRVECPAEYPFKSPSIGFRDRIFHPNVDEASGTVCLDVINQTWSPMYNLVNVFDMFLPQLLTYPNPNDPLNGEAAAMLLRDPKAFDRRVRDYVARHATPKVSPSKTDDLDMATTTTTSVARPVVGRKERFPASGVDSDVGGSFSSSSLSSAHSLQFGSPPTSGLSLKSSPTSDPSQKMDMVMHEAAIQASKDLLGDDADF